MRRGFSHLTLAMALGNTIFAASVQAASTLYVDGAGACGGNSPCFTTIQAAINAASPGDTIVVFKGTYAEEITINKGLTLLGPNAGINPNMGTRVAEAVIVPMASGSGPVDPAFAGPQIVTLAADGITFNGFTVDGDNPNLTSGVSYNGADVDAEFGIYGTGNTANPDAVIVNNIVKNIGEVAVWIDAGNVGAPKDDVSEIANNKVDNCLGSFGQGIRIDNGAWVSILSNVVTRVRNGIVIENYTGAGTPSTHPPSVIGDNSVTSCRIGIRQNLHQAYDPPGFTISNNTVTSYVQSVFPSQVDPAPTAYQSIRMDSIRGADFATVSGNTLTGNHAALTAAGYTRVEGLDVTNASSESPNISFDHNKVMDFIRGAFNEAPVVPTLSCNVFQMNTTGIYLSTDATVGLVAHNNNIAGNGFGLQNDGPASVNAEQNWWGAADGPGPVGPGSGDKVSTNVDFSNFLTSAASCASKADQQITFGALANKTFGDPDFTVSATASSGLPVSFTASGQCTVSGNLVHLTGAGSCTITASQDGDSNYNPAPDVMQTFTVAKASTATAVSSSANPSTSGQNVTFTAIVTSSAGIPTGTVQFVIDGSNFGGPVTLSNGSAQISTSSLTVTGSPHSVSATYGGDSNFLGSMGSLASGQTVNAPTPTPTATATATATPTATATATPTAIPAQALNISTRLRVELGDKVMIGGFIITGSVSKPVVVRGLGPSLVDAGVPAASVLNDPVLELHGPDGALIAQNDNWKDSPQRSQIEGGPYQPTNDRESVILATLQPGNYTAILRGVGQTTGVGLVEVYDADQSVNSVLANISTRGFVQTQENVMVGGFMLGGSPSSTRVAIRGRGPSLANSGLSNVLADPTLELHNGNGALLIANDNWQDDPASAAQLTANGLALQDPKESGIFTTLPPGAFTAILAGKNSTTGIGLVEIYNLK